MYEIKNQEKIFVDGRVGGLRDGQMGWKSVTFYI